MTETTTIEKKSKPIWVKLWPFYIILAGLAFAISQGWHTQLTPEGLSKNAAFLDAKLEENFIFVLLAFIGIYMAATAFMVPASVLTIAGGFLFGVYIGAPATVLGATIGACILFVAAKSSIGEALKSIAGPFIGKMEAGFNESPFSYLFSLRLIPIFPFAVVNIAPAILGAKFRDYFITTLFGIIPGTIAYSLIGSGLREALDKATAAGENLNFGTFIADSGKALFPAFVALALVALMPAIYKKFFKKNTPGTETA